MKKYIELEAAINEFDYQSQFYDAEWGNKRFAPDDVETIIRSVPAVDVVPVRHGKWIRKRTVEHEGEWYCSICGKDMLYTWGPGCGLADYCPHCGAKMDGDGE